MWARLLINILVATLWIPGLWIAYTLESTALPPMLAASGAVLEGR